MGFELEKMTFTNYRHEFILECSWVDKIMNKISVIVKLNVFIYLISYKYRFIDISLHISYIN